MGALVQLLAFLLIAGVVVWGIFQLLPLMQLPDPINRVITVVVVVIVVVILAYMLVGAIGGGGGLRLGRL